MGKREYAFNRMLRQKLEEFGFSFYRVENHGIEPGMPDVHFVTNDGLTGWIELKDEQGRVPHRLKYEKGQVPWLIDYDQRGGFCCTIFRYTYGNIDMFGVVAAKDSIIAERNLDDTTTAVFDSSNPHYWFGIANLIRDGAQRALWRLHGTIPATPGYYTRESQQQDLVGAVRRTHRSL